MVSTVTTTVTTLALAGGFALLSIVTLLALLVQREMTSVLKGAHWMRVRQGLTVVIVPLWLLFFALGLVRVAEVLR
jgi:hypothetical protein